MSLKLNDDMISSITCSDSIINCLGNVIHIGRSDSTNVDPSAIQQIDVVLAGQKLYLLDCGENKTKMAHQDLVPTN